MTTKTLLDKAKSAPINRNLPAFDQAELEKLAVAWVQGEVTFTQVSKATNRRGMSVYGLLANALKRAVEAGRASIV